MKKKDIPKEHLNEKDTPVSEMTPDQIQAQNQRRKRRKRKQIILNALIVLFSGLFVFSAVKLIQTQREYAEVDAVIEEQLQYKPTVQDLGEMIRPARPTIPPTQNETENTSSENTSGEDLPSEDATSEDKASDVPSEKVDEPPVMTNPTIIELQKTYPDVCGWIHLDGTNIDNLYAKGKDNQRYERKDLNGKYLVAGTLFLDFRSTRDFTSFNTVLYGHNMRNGTMFGDLDYYEKTDYFNSHKTGTVYLPHATYGLEIFALLVIPSVDPVIYNSYTEEDDTVEAKTAFLEYVKENARQYRDVGVTVEDTILTLSTCSYEYDGARYVLLARLMEYSGNSTAEGG